MRARFWIIAATAGTPAQLVVSNVARRPTPRRAIIKLEIRTRPDCVGAIRWTPRPLPLRRSAQRGSLSDSRSLLLLSTVDLSRRSARGSRNEAFTSSIGGGGLFLLERVTLTTIATATRAISMPAATASHRRLRGGAEGSRQLLNLSRVIRTRPGGSYAS